MRRSQHLAELFMLNWKMDGGSGLDLRGYLDMTGRNSASEVTLDEVSLLLAWSGEQRKREAEQCNRK